MHTVILSLCKGIVRHSSPTSPKLWCLVRLVLAKCGSYISVRQPQGSFGNSSLYHECREGMDSDKKQYINPIPSYYYKCVAMSLHFT